MRTSKSTNKATVLDFDSWGDFLEYCRQPLPHDAYAKSGHETTGHYTKDWSGTNTFDEALTLGVLGWEEKVVEARKLSDGLIAKVLDKLAVPTIHYDVEGIDFDMSRVNRGEPEAWYRFEEHITNNEGDAVVKIVVNSVASCGVSAESIIRRGAIIAALVELLEFAHKKVEVINHTSFDYGTIEFRTIVKTAHQPLDMARLMYMCGHPSYLRRLLFHCIESNPVEHRKCGMGYGNPADLDAIDRGDIYFGKMHYAENEKWFKEPEAFVIDQLKAQGIEVKQ